MASPELKSVKHKSNENKRDEPRFLTQAFDLHAFDTHINLTYSNTVKGYKEKELGEEVRRKLEVHKIGLITVFDAILTGRQSGPAQITVFVWESQLEANNLFQNGILHKL